MVASWSSGICFSDDALTNSQSRITVHRLDNLPTLYTQKKNHGFKRNWITWRSVFGLNKYWRVTVPGSAPPSWGQSVHLPLDLKQQSGTPWSQWGWLQHFLDKHRWCRRLCRCQNPSHTHCRRHRLGRSVNKGKLLNALRRRLFLYLFS